MGGKKEPGKYRGIVSYTYKRFAIYSAIGTKENIPVYSDNVTISNIIRCRRSYLSFYYFIEGGKEK